MSFVRLLLPVALGAAALFAFTGNAHASSKPPASKQLSDSEARAIEQALATADPRTIRALAAKLEQRGFVEQARDLREAADAIERATHNVPPVKPGDSPKPTTGTTPILSDGSSSTPAASPERLLAGKVALMLTNSSPGRESKSMVESFQLQEQGLGRLAVGKADGLYGPKTALALAKGYGIVPPKPYYWPRVNRAGAVSAYRAELLNFAAKDVPRAEEWRAAANVK